MIKPGNARSLLTSTARVATLVCVGVAETACNLQVSSYPDRPDAGRDGGEADASAVDASVQDASIRDSPMLDASTSDAGESLDAAGELTDAPVVDDDGGPP